ncbi:MAG: 16S rRNA (uracil(1498)-N(3))-methyltransferase [Candidatus Omnitrophica bacterium]|nr:16S rRNA (uracil(1498)-N(3))-methyltransferase [Candidatus Omnitrophota bacterium]
MHCFYIDKVDLKAHKVFISAEQAKHAHKVLRLKIGDQVTAFDGKGNQYRGALETINSNSAVIAIEKLSHFEPPLPKITLAAAIPKQSKFDAIVDKATQLGVDMLIPLISERTIVKPDLLKQNDKIIRWQKIAIEAAKQCGCLYVPRIAPIHSFNQIAKNAVKFDLAIIAALSAQVVFIKDVFKKEKPESVLVLIGPEGDFTQQEVKFACDSGAIAVSLGKNVLRCETASTMVLSILNYEWKT